MDFSARSRLPEIIDSPHDLSLVEMQRTLLELGMVNRWLGGTGSCLKAVRRRIRDLQRERKGAVRILDAGCGGADIPRALVDWCRSKAVAVTVVAFDFSPTACRIASHRVREYPEIVIVRADVLNLPFSRRAFDFALCSAFLHHFGDREIDRVLFGLAATCSRAILVNDLQRHRLAYYGIRFLTAVFSRSRAVKYDGPVSVLKGFRRSELKRVIMATNLTQATIRWRWAFRWVMEIDLQDRRW